MRTPSLARKAGSHVIVCHATGLQPCGGESDRHFRQDKTRHFLLFLTANFHVAKIQLKIHQNRIYFTYLTTIFTFSTLITYPNHPTPWGRPLSRIAIPHYSPHPRAHPLVGTLGRSVRVISYTTNPKQTFLNLPDAPTERPYKLVSVAMKFTPNLRTLTFCPYVL